MFSTFFGKLLGMKRRYRAAGLSAAAQDASGLPSQETLDMLQGYTLLRTDLNGWVELTTDGKQVWVEVGKR
jgi:beta-lactamase superfamily II metal-dependent hydrolase